MCHRLPRAVVRPLGRLERLEDRAVPAIVAVGAGPGADPLVRVFNADGSQRFILAPYGPAFRGGVHVATGDVTGDGVEDIVTAPGFGGGPHLKLFDGVTGALVREWMAFDPEFRGGVWVAIGDVPDDGKGGVLVGRGRSGAPQLRAFDAVANAIVKDFIRGGTFSGGVTVAVGDDGRRHRRPYHRRRFQRHYHWG